jgi:hypothetical protein
MFEICERAGREVGYWATRYLQMLRARGGLETARRLLKAQATSAGYEALRSAGRLDLTVEAYVLRPEFQTLFTIAELDRGERLDFFGQLAETDVRRAEAAQPELMRLLEEVAAAAPIDRIGFRDRVAAFGRPAIPIPEAWVDAGGTSGFACAAIEAIGLAGARRDAAFALRRLATRHPEWASVAEAAATRIDGKQWKP